MSTWDLFFSIGHGGIVMVMICVIIWWSFFCWSCVWGIENSWRMCELYGNEGGSNQKITPNRIHQCVVNFIDVYVPLYFRSCHLKRPSSSSQREIDNIVNWNCFTPRLPISLLWCRDLSFMCSVAWFSEYYWTGVHLPIIPYL